MKKSAADFGNKVAANQLDSVQMLYPEAEEADSLALKFVADEIHVENGEGENEYLVKYGESATMIVLVAEDGKMKVKCL